MRTAEDLAAELTQLREHARLMERQRDEWRKRAELAEANLRGTHITVHALHTLVRAGSPIVNVDCSCGQAFYNEADWLLHRAAFPDHHPA